MNTKILISTLFALAAWTAPAVAANTATVTTDLNLRAGPSTQYPVVTVVPRSAPVTIYGCNANVSWCDISSGSYRGWASASYIRVSSGGTAVVVTPVVVSTVGLPTVTYSRVYWDTHYAAYPWYRPWNARYSTVTGKAGCVGSACGAKRTVTGPYGGTASRKAGCVNGVCGGRAKATGPNGHTASRAWGCSSATGNCRVRRTGPAGNSVTRHRGSWR